AVLVEPSDPPGADQFRRHPRPAAVLPGGQAGVVAGQDGGRPVLQRGGGRVPPCPSSTSLTFTRRADTNFQAARPAQTHPSCPTQPPRHPPTQPPTSALKTSAEGCVALGAEMVPC